MGPQVGKTENMEEKTLCCMVLDDSGSMDGSPIQQLNEGLKSFAQDIEDDVRLSNGLELALIKFGSDVEVIQEPALIYDVTMPTLTADSGLTSLNEAVREAIRTVEDRKAYYKQSKMTYKRPWIVVLTDGAPTDGDVGALASQIETDTKNGSYVLLTIGVDGADMGTLNQMAGYIKKEDGSFEKMSALSLESAKFSEFFEWLSKSMAIVHDSKDGEGVTMPEPTWMKGFVA